MDEPLQARQTREVISTPKGQKAFRLHDVITYKQTVMFVYIRAIHKKTI